MRVIDENKLNNTLHFIRSYQTREGRTPSYRIIQKECRFSSLSSVSLYVDTLKKRRLIETDHHNSWKQIALPDYLKKQGSHNSFIVSTVHHGLPSETAEDIEAYVALPDEIFGSADHVILHAVGPSMINRGIFDGDYLVVRQTQSANYGQTVIAMLEDGKATCKILARDGEQDYLRAANDKTKGGKRIYDIYPNGNWSIYGVVEFVIHKLVPDEL